MKVEMIGICKSFGKNDVLKNIDFSIESADICALLGENGAGKSTLMNILGGVISADSGKILVDGQQVDFTSPADSINKGIAFIHQELNLINDLPIYENMFIGRELKKKNGFLDSQSMIEKTKEIFKKMQIDINPQTYVRDLDASYKQIVEIARAMMMNASIIIMDEPTTSLTEPEIQRIFELMRQLQKQNVGIIFISHKLQEVLEICNKYTVLRDGHLIISESTKGVTTSDLAFYMVGHKVNANISDSNVKLGKEILKVQNYSDEKYFHDISFSAHQGEILGITGLLGDGRSELFLSLFGEGKKTDGKYFIDGEEVCFSSAAQAVKKGFAYVPRNRKENAIIKDLNILENGTLATLKDYVKYLLLNTTKQKDVFNEYSKELHIKMGSDKDLITSLSGGNQQKVILAKWLISNPRVLVLDNPTQGVDVGAKEEIYEIIRKLSKSNVAVIVLSSEAQEIMQVCSRALIMFHGKLMGEVKGKSMNEHTIMRMATGERI